MGVAKGVDATELRNAYKRLSLKLHPDKGGDAESFAEMSGAYELLSDPAKRAQHDAGSQGGQPGGFHGFHFSHQDWHRAYGGGQPHGTNLYDNALLITHIDPAEWASRVAFSHSAFLVNFYAPWCGHCVQMVPQFKLLAELLFELEVDVEVGVVNCDLHMDLCRQQGVQNFPQIQLLVPTVVRPLEARRTQEPPPTFLWASRGGGAGTEELTEWVRGELAVYNRSRVATFRDSDEFDRVVLGSDPLWLIVFIARGGSNWCPACVAVEAQFRRLAAGVSEWASPQEQHAAFGAVDCEDQELRPLCIRYSLGHPYGQSRGDFPQVLAFARGPYKNAPERLLPQHAQFINQMTERIEWTDRIIRASLGIVPGWARSASAVGERFTSWSRHRDPHSGRDYYNNLVTKQSVWTPPLGWHAAGPDLQTVAIAREEEAGATPAPPPTQHDEL